MRQLPQRQAHFLNKISNPDHLLFWQNWRSPYRLLYLSSLVLLLICLTLFASAALLGPSAVLEWQAQSELQAVPLTLDRFTKGLFTFSVEASSYSIMQRFAPSDMQLNAAVPYLYAALLALSTVLLLSVVTVLPRLWYLGSMIVFILWLASCKLDLLQVFGDTGRLFFIGSVILLVPVSYYIHAFRIDVPFVRRIGIFALLMAVLVGVAAFFSRNSNPLLTSLSYGSIVPLVLSALFILMVSPEIMRSFMFLVTQSGSPSSLLHFTLLTIIYLVNLVLRYLYNTQKIDWDILYINSFFILAISVILGIWGFRKRSTLFAHIVTDPYVSLLYTGLASLTLATIGYAFATGNDPMIEMFENLILYSHIAMAIAFFFYVVINFRQPMQQGLPVYKVIFQPRQFPMSYTWALTAVILFAFMLQVSMLPFYLGVAGFNNGLGDLYALQKDDLLAEPYYQLAQQYGYNNHKSNYSAASVAIRQNDPVKAAEYLRTALKKKPLPHTFARLSNLYLQEDLLFEAMFTLKDGIKAFPESGELYNNLAMLYNRSNIRDTAFYYYTLAAKYTPNAEVPRVNQLAFWIKNPSLTNTDSLWQTVSPSGSVPLENNRLLLASMIGKTDKQPAPEFFRRDSVLNIEQFAYGFNYLLNHKAQADSSLVTQLEKYQRIDGNAFFYDDLEMAQSCLQYYGLDRSMGLELLNGLRAGSGQKAAYFNKILGLWYLQNDAYRIAANFFGNAVAAGDSTMRMNQAISLAEAGSWNESLTICREEQLNPDAGVRTVANRLSLVLQALQNTTADAASPLDDAGKVLLVRLNKTNPPVTLPPIRGNAYRVTGFIELAKNHLARNQIIQAEEAYRSAAQIEPNNPLVRELALELMAAKGQYANLLKVLGDPLPTDEAQAKKSYWEALSYENTGKIPLASTLYEQALHRLPLDETVVMAAARFYQNKQKNPDRAYAILVEAVRLNPYSPAIYKAYILQALEMQLLDYAAKGLEELRTITTPADYQAFLPQYEAKRVAVEKLAGDWQ